MDSTVNDLRAEIADLKRKLEIVAEVIGDIAKATADVNYRGNDDPNDIADLAPYRIGMIKAMVERLQATI